MPSHEASRRLSHEASRRSRPVVVGGTTTASWDASVGSAKLSPRVMAVLAQNRIRTAVELEGGASTTAAPIGDEVTPFDAA